MSDDDNTCDTDSIEEELRRLVHAPPVDPDEFFRGTRAMRLEPGTVIDGSFVVRERLGQGGMGVVYRAHDEALNRDVAIKLCRRQINERDTARLLREAQANAALAHPNIVVVHQVGTVDDQVYLVMEHVGGGTLRDWLDNKPRRWQDIVGKLVEAGQGLAEAHALGLVHRDFKPDNVLIGDDERARVSDFGLALPVVGANEADERTTRRDGSDISSADITMQRAGTPRYMAPEQHAGIDVSSATDQFAWCLVLYEALAGEHPFEGDLAKPDARRRRSAMPRRIPARIRSAIERGLAPDPTHRHASMSDLLARLDKNSPWNATIAVLGVGVIGATIAGLATSAPEDPCAAPLVDAPQWPDDARQRLMHVFRTSTLGDGEALGRRVVARLDGYLSDWNQAEFDVCRDAVDEPEELEARHACLGLRAVEFESLLEVLAAGQPEVLARSLGAAARLTPPESCATTRPSRLARDLAPHDGRLNDHLARASTAVSAGDMQLAMRHADAALASAGDDYGRARATMVRYRVLDKTKDHTAAAKEGEEALRFAIRAGADEVAADATRLLVYTAIAGQGEPEPARRWAEHADAWLTRLGDPAEGRITLDAYRGFILRETRKYEEAELLLRDVLRRALTLDPPLPQKLVSIRLGLASTLQHTGDHGKAEAELNAALVTIDGELGVNHPARLGVLQMLSALMWRTGRSDEGIALSLEVVAGYERLHGPQSPSAAEAEFNLGLNMFGHGDFEGARKHTQAALAVFETHGDLKRQDMAVRNLSQIALMTNDLESALDLAKRDVELAKQVDDKPEHVLALVNVAMIRNRRGDYEEAYDTAKRISELASVAFEATDPYRAFAWLTLGNTAKDVGKLDEARAAFEAGIALLRATTGERDPNWVFLAAGLADAHYQAGRYDDALALLEGLDLSAMHRDEDRLDATRLVTAVHVARNDHAAAREALSRARGYAETIGTAEATAMIDELAATVD